MAGDYVLGPISMVGYSQRCSIALTFSSKQKSLLTGREKQGERCAIITGSPSSWSLQRTEGVFDVFFYEGLYFLKNFRKGWSINANSPGGPRAHRRRG